MVCLQPASPLAAKLKEEASKCFGRKDYPKALEAYEAALKAMDEDASNSNKAACYLMQQKCASLPVHCESASDQAPYCDGLEGHGRGCQQ